MTDVDVVIPCYEIGRQVYKTVDAVLSQAVSHDVRYRVILVDDGSSENGAVSPAVESTDVSVVRHTRNRGRAAACNSGAQAGLGDLIWFLDADCVPESVTTLQAHLEAMAGYDVSVGPVRTNGTGFWGRYQNRVTESRLARLRAGMDINACTSANLLVRRAAFETLGGFDERYTRYGFEDRDLLLRLTAGKFRLTFSEGAGVFHEVDLDLLTVCRKLRTAGQYSSGIFRAAHFGAYRATGYGKLDARDRGAWFGVTIRGLWPVLRAAARAANRMLEVNLVPFVLRLAMAKSYSAAAYAYGTLLAKRKTDTDSASP